MGLVAAVALVAGTVAALIVVAVAVRSGRIRLAWGAAVAALAFQGAHFLEHGLQLVAWVARPERPPWMSPWATGLADGLGSLAAVLPGKGQASRGMEAMHLLGNLVFLAATVALFWLAHRWAAGRRSATAALAVQSFHVAEHVVLCVTLVVSGRAIGLSTWFGTLSGSQLSTHRVWWHFLVNLAATVLAGTALGALVRARSNASSSARGPVLAWRPAMVAAATIGIVGLATPPVVAHAAGEPARLFGADGHHGWSTAVAPDTERTGDPTAGQVRFTDVAAATGLHFRQGAFRWGVSMDPAAMMGGGVCWIDMDRDGWLDLFVVNSWAEAEWARWRDDEGLPTTALFRNDHGQFVDVSEAAGAAHEVRGNGCVAADFDRDGWTDLYVTTARTNVLLWNDRGRGFVEGARAAGVDGYGWHTGVAAGDLNGDGWLDLFVAGYVDVNNRIPDATRGFPNIFQPVRDLVYLSNGPDSSGRVTFREVGEDLGVEAGQREYGLGVLITDVDGDGAPDVYVANDTNPNRLYHNEPVAGADPAGLGFRLVECAEEAGVADPNSGMGVAAGDLDGDRRPDLVVTNLGRQYHTAFRNLGREGTVPRFEDAARLTGTATLGAGDTGWGVTLGDLDLDTDLDLLLAHGAIPVTEPEADAEPLRMYANEADDGTPGRLRDVSGIVGLERVLLNARGAALGDYDNDGDLDLVVNSIGSHLSLLANSGAEGHWLAVDLGGAVPGAVVTAELADGTRLVRQVGAGSSYLSSEDPRPHFGLGRHDRVRRLEVRWPDGSVTTRTDVTADRLVTVEADERAQRRRG